MRNLTIDINIWMLWLFLLGLWPTHVLAQDDLREIYTSEADVVSLAAGKPSPQPSAAALCAGRVIPLSLPLLAPVSPTGIGCCCNPEPDF